MKQIKGRVRIIVDLDSGGRLHVEATSQNMVTVCGMLEVAKKIILETQKVQDSSRIVVPEINGNGGHIVP